MYTTPYYSIFHKNTIIDVLEAAAQSSLVEQHDDKLPREFTSAPASCSLYIETLYLNRVRIKNQYSDVVYTKFFIF